MEKFESVIHASPDETAGVNTSQNSESRKAGRLERFSEPPEVSLPITKDNIGTMIAVELKEDKMTSARAQAFLNKIKAFGITCEDSNKWRKRCDRLNKLL